MAYTTIDDPSAHFHTQLYTGNGSSGLSITNDANAGDFQPDFLWIKSRSITDNNVVLDSSRTSEKRLKTNSTDAEDSNDPALITFETDGFDLDTTDAAFNQSSATYVAWQWKANGGSTTTNDASATSVGNQDSTYQANTTAGFSIVTYNGVSQVGTMAHGLGVVPHVMIVKCRSADGERWETYHHKNTSAPETDHLELSATDATSDSAHTWNDTAPTSTIFTVNNSGSNNEDGKTYLMYLFSEIQGYSKFGGYTGNGDADGPFIYTGFKPSWVMIKETSNADNWYIYDNKRSPFNVVNDYLQAENTEVEGTTSINLLDFVSNGFKSRGDGGTTNTSGSNYIYMAFAHQPFVTSGGVPCTAR